VNFTIRGDYFKVQHQTGMLIAYGIASQCLLHWGLKWSFLDYTLHYSGTKSTCYSGWILDGAATCLYHPSLTRTCHQPQCPQLWMKARVSLAVVGTVSPMAVVGSALWVLCERFFPACAMAEPEQSPSTLHPGPDGDSCSLPGFAKPNPTATAEKALLYSWHTSGTCKGEMQF